MRNHTVKILLLALSFSFGACRDMGAQDLANKASEVLHVPVMFWAYNTDECAKKQVQAVVDAYEATVPARQNEFIRKLQASVDAVVVNATVNKGSIEGQYSIIQLARRTCRRNSDRCLDISRVKTFDQRVMATDNNLFPDVTLEIADRVLYVTPASAQDRSKTRTWWLSDAAVFDSITGDELLTESFQLQSVIKTESVQHNQLNCGRMLNVEEIRQYIEMQLVQQQ